MIMRKIFLTAHFNHNNIKTMRTNFKTAIMINNQLQYNLYNNQPTITTMTTNSITTISIPTPMSVNQPFELLLDFWGRL